MNFDSSDSSPWLDSFEWDSPDQEKGYLGFLSWSKRKAVSCLIRPIDLFLFQKDHDSHVYWLELVSTQFNQLRSDVTILQRRVIELESKLRELEGE